MRFLITALLFPLAAVSQSTLLFQALPGHVTLDLLLLLTLGVGLRNGAAAGSAAGLWAGALVGAMRGVGSPSLAVLYGLVGWLAGLHHGRQPARWTYPLAGCALLLLFAALEAQLMALMGEGAPPLSWLLPSLAWHALACLVLLGARRSRPEPFLPAGPG